MAGDNIITVSGKKDFEDKVLNSDTPVLVDFWAAWCGPCRMVAPVVADIAKEYKGNLTVAKVDVEDENNKQLAAEYGIMSLPTVALFKPNERPQGIIGFRPKSAMEKWLDEMGINKPEKAVREDESVEKTEEAGQDNLPKESTEESEDMDIQKPEKAA